VGILCLLFTAVFLAQDVSAQVCGNGLCEAGSGRGGGETPDTCPADCAEPDCGNGNLDLGEACDGSNLDGLSCTGLGFPGGSLSCDAFCNFDTSGCNPASCGDGICGLDRFGNEETADSCSVDCTPPVTDCGNNVIENPEVCDGTNFGGLTCLDFGFEVVGELTCGFDDEGNPCSQITLEQCLPLCGNFELDLGETCENVIVSLPDPPVFDNNCRPNFCTSCGDSNLDFQEECDDGNNVNGDTCDEFCFIEPFCGDGSIDPGEVCEGADLDGRNCVSLGFDGGSLSCASCGFDTRACTGTGPMCGNGAATGLEECDGDDLLGQTCIDLGFIGGSLSCNGSCEFNKNDCTSPAPFCGDGAATGLEECDGADLLGKTCTTEGFDFGDLSCLEFCVLDTFDCRSLSDFCTDGTIKPPEQCEFNDLNGQTCTDLGFDGGDLACSTASATDCKFNTSDCTGGPECGDGLAVGGEICDGTDLLGQTCIRLGFDGGDLRCTASCGYDTNDCTVSSICGNGIAEAGGGEQGDEACDGGDLLGQTCAGLGFDGGTLGCTASCGYDTNDCTGGPECGDGVVNGEDECDGESFNGRTCTDLGFIGGTLICNEFCEFVTGACTAPGPGDLQGRASIAGSCGADADPPVTDLDTLFNFVPSGDFAITITNTGNAPAEFRAARTLCLNDMDVDRPCTLKFAADPGVSFADKTEDEMVGWHHQLYGHEFE